METILKKNRKKRGHASMGHGNINKKKKHPSGRGNAGGMHHLHILFDKYHPGYFGKVGMRHFHKLRKHYRCPIIDIEKLWSLVLEDVKAKATPDSFPLMDVTYFRFFKALGKAEIPLQPLIMKAKLISK